MTKFCNSILCLAFSILAGCTHGGSSPTVLPTSGPILTVTIDGGGQVTLIGETCTQAKSPCQYSITREQAVELAVYPTANLAFYSWSNCSVPKGTLCNQTISSSLNITAHFGPINLLVPNPPGDPILTLADSDTKSSLLAHKPNISDVIGNDSTSVKWCLSEAQSDRPYNAASPCASPEGSSPVDTNGWSTTRPTSLNLSSGDGSKLVYVWIANARGDVNLHAVAAAITLDTAIPQTPSIQMSDLITGSTSNTSAALVNLSLTSSTLSPQWCIVEQASTLPLPPTPDLNSPCFSKSPPTQLTLAAIGSRSAIAFTKSFSGNISLPGMSTILYSSILPSLSIDSPSAFGGATLSATLALSDLSPVDVSVHYSELDGTAISGKNYVPTSGTVVISAGELSVKIPIQTIAETTSGPSKAFLIVLDLPVNASIATASSSATIYNTVAGPVISISSTSAPEGSPLKFVITQSAPSGYDTTFNLQATDGTAVSGTNYLTTNVFTVIPAGATSTTVLVPTLDDGLYTPNLTVLATLKSVSGATLGGYQAVGIINNSDAIPNLSISAADVIEGQTITANVKQTTVTGFKSTFNFATGDGSGISGVNYAPTQASLSIAKGAIATSIQVPTIDSKMYGPDKSVVLNISSPSHVGVSLGSATVQIKNSHFAPYLSVIAASAIRGQPIKFTVLQSAVTGYDTTFNYSTADGTAVAGKEYAKTVGSGVIPAGSTSTTIIVPTIASGIYSATKNMTLSISSPDYATIATAQASGAIVSTAGSNLSITSASANEGSDLQFAVSLSAVLPNDVHVDYATSDLSARAGLNYTSLSGTLVIPAGSSSGVITIHSLPDNRYAPTRTMNVFLIGSIDASISQSTAIGSILNTDPPPTVSVADASAGAGGNLVFNITQSNISGVDTIISFTPHDGTAIHGINYSAQAQAAVIPAGKISTAYSLQTIDSGFYGPSVSMTLQATQISGATALKDTGTGTITNSYSSPVVSIASAQAVEGQPLVFKVTQSAISVVDTTVMAVTSDGSAIASKNYSSTQAVVTIPAGFRVVDFTVPTIDTLASGLTTQMVVNLQKPTNATIGNGNAIGSILSNNGAPYLSVPQITSANEGQPLLFVISQSNVTKTDTTVTYNTSDGTAQAPKNYLGKTGSAIIPAGATSVSVQVPTIADNVYSSNSRSMSFSITDPKNALLNPSSTSSIGTILNIYPKPTLSIANVSVTEGAPATFTAQLSAISADASYFNFQTLDQSAVSPLNYIGQKGNITIPAGQTSVDFSIATSDDKTFNPALTFGLTLSGLLGIQANQIIPTGSILNVDPPPGIAVADNAGNEGLPVIFTVTQDNISGFDTTFKYQTRDGTAVGGLDYTISSGAVTILAGKLSASISVPTIDRGVFASVKTFTLNISAPSNASITQSLAQGTINNNHSAPLLAISNAEVLEGGILDFTVSQSALSGLDTTFSFATVDQTALSGTNYVASTGTIKILAGSISAEIKIQTTEDFLNTPARLMNVVLSNASNANIDQGTGLGTIDNIDGTPNLSVSNAFTNEGSDLTFTITSSSISANDLSVTFQTSDSTAVAGANYTARGGIATIPKGSKSTTVNVPTIHDGLYSLSSNLKMTLSLPVNAQITNGVAIGTINNIDPIPVISISSASALDGQPLIFTATQGAVSAVDSVVSFETFNGTAVWPANYAYTKSTFLISAGKTSTQFAFATFDSHAYGSNLSMNVTLSSPINASLQVSSIQGVIINHYPPAAPSFAIADTLTSSYSLTNSSTVQASIGPGLGLKWCLSTSILAKPLLGSDACLGGAVGNNVDNGWYTVAPTSFKMPDGDGLKTVYLWIADQYGKISDTTSAQITLDTSSPVTPIVSLSDSRTGSTTLTNKSSVTLSITGDTSAPAAIAWCVFESASGAAIPKSPLFSDTCWVSSRPTIQALGSLGSRSVYVFTKSAVQNISAAGLATINYSAQPPADPTMVLSDATTGSNLYVRQNSAQIVIGNDSTTSLWCVSEIQSARPSSGLNPCLGGNGTSSGWATVRPTSIKLSTGDGQKSVYVWVVDDADNVSLDVVSKTIIVDTVLPSTQSITLSDPNTSSSSFTNQSTVNASIVNDLKANSWILLEQGSQPVPSAPLFSDARWSSTRPASLSLSTTGMRVGYLWTMSAALNVSATKATNTIDYETTLPMPAGLTLSDGVTGKIHDYTSSTKINVSVSPMPTSQRYCLSEIQMSAPTLGTSMCLGGQSGSVDGWSLSAPLQFSTSSGDGKKTLFLWVADAYNNVSNSLTTASINLDTTTPPAPVVTLSDVNTGSVSATNQMIVNLSITGDTGAIGWCVIEKTSTDTPPLAAPIFSDSCWQTARPAQTTLTKVGTRTVYVYTENHAASASLTYGSASIDNSNQPPSTPTLSLKDPATGSAAFVRQNSVVPTIGSLSVTLWCLSETQVVIPLSGIAKCNGGAGPANGWYVSVPLSIPLSVGDGLKTVYLWVANSHNNVSQTAVKAAITVDTMVPSTPIVALSDPSTSSVVITTSTTPKLTITGDTATPAAVGWCPLEQDASYTAPNPPTFNSACWVSTRPISATLASYGKRSVYVYTKSSTQNISLAGLASITLVHAPPTNPYFQVSDSTTGSTSYALSQAVKYYIASYGTYQKWCVSETQTTAPADGNSACLGGAGPALGWFTAAPAGGTLSAGDGQKTVYLWVSDQYNGVSVGPSKFSITLNTIIPATPSVIVQDINTGSQSLTNRRTANLKLATTDASVSYWYVIDVLAGTNTTPPTYNPYNYGWVSTPPTSITFSGYGNRTVLAYTRSLSFKISLAGSATINFANTGPGVPALALSDAVTGDVSWIRQTSVQTAITNDTGVVLWCLSETQSSAPASGSASCVGGEGSANGWFTSRPTSFLVSSANRTNKTIYLWVADSNGDVNNGYNGAVYDTITLDTTIPVAATNFTVADSVTNSTSIATSSRLNIRFSWAPDTYYACLIEAANTDPAPTVPSFNDPCWTYAPNLTSTTVTGQGQRSFYLYGRTSALTVSPTPAVATINVQTNPPAAPTNFTLVDNPSPPSIARQHRVSVNFTNPSGVTQWCLSETQKTAPTLSLCAGGQGSANGWFTTQPYLWTLSAGDGLKTVYLWVIDALGNVSVSAAQASITMQSPIIPTTPIVAVIESGSVTTSPVNNPGNIQISNDSNAVKWCLLEKLQSLGTYQYLQASDTCWTSVKPTTLVFAYPHQGTYVEVNTMSSTGDMSTVGVAAINFNQVPPAPATLSLNDPNTGSSSTTSQAYVIAQIRNDSSSARYCLSETQSSKPSSNSAPCVGGAGEYNGWFGERPSFLSLSAGTGKKTAYLWVADQWGYVSLTSGVASITLGIGAVAIPNIVVSDSASGSTANTSSGSISVLVGNPSTASAWCGIDVASGSGVPQKPAVSSTCWQSANPFAMTLLVNGSRSIYVYAKDNFGNISNSPGVGMIQFGADSNPITSTVLTSGGSSPLLAPSFSISNSVSYYFYKYSNQAKDCNSDGDALHPYSAIKPNSSAILDSIVSLLDGDIYLCVDPVSSAASTPNFALAQYFHWVKEAAWSEEAFLKSPSTATGVAYGFSTAIYNNFLIVGDPLSKNGSYPGEVFIYSINSSNSVSPVASFGGYFFGNTAERGSGSRLATSTNGILAAGVGESYGFVYLYKLNSVVSGVTPQPAYTIYQPSSATPGFSNLTGPGSLGAIAFDPVNPNLMVVGWPGMYGGPNAHGAYINKAVGGVALYQYSSASNSWVMDSWYSTNEQAPGDALIGTSVAIYNGTIVSGAPGRSTPISGGTQQTGAVYVWTKTANSALQSFLAPTILQGSADTARGHEIGYNVSIYHDALGNKNVIMVGDAKDSTNGASSGVVYYWSQDTLGSYSGPAGKLFSQNGKANTAGAMFGSSLAVGGNHIIVGASGTSGASTSAVVFNYENGGFGEKASLSSSIALYNGSSYGTSVAASSQYILIGSPLDTTVNPASNGVLIAPPSGAGGPDIGGVSIFNGYR